MADFRAPKEPVEVFKDVTYVIYLYEPSTQWWNLRGIATYIRDAQKLAKSQVDDACKTEGWIYKRLGNKFYPIGYAFLEGDGGIGVKELVSDHVHLIEEATQGDGEVLMPGWYFSDEIEDMHGPFETIEGAHEALKKYAETL